MPAQPFTVGETVLLIDRGGNRRLLKLKAGAKAHGHKGYLEHDRIIGAAEGTLVRASSGATYLTFRPRLTEFVLEIIERVMSDIETWAAFAARAREAIYAACDRDRYATDLVAFFREVETKASDFGQTA